MSQQDRIDAIGIAKRPILPFSQISGVDINPTRCDGDFHAVNQVTDLGGFGQKLTARLEVFKPLFFSSAVLPTAQAMQG